jgi:pre-mRNA-splicing factor ATP-dependent RNA helicase DHX15/PRP43
LFPYDAVNPDKTDKDWPWKNFVSARALAQAENVRTQLERTMERLGIESVSLDNQVKLYTSVRRALVCGFFMQVAHKEGEKGNYLTVKDNQVSGRSVLVRSFFANVGVN